MNKRIFVDEVAQYSNDEVTLNGWVKFLRVQKKITFLVLQDCSGTIQITGSTPLPIHLKREDVITVRGRVRQDVRASGGYEIQLLDLQLLSSAGTNLPFSSGSPEEVQDINLLTQYRPLSLRTDRVGQIFRIQAELLQAFRNFLYQHRFTEIVTSKIVSNGTEGGANLFNIKYFDRLAYLAQSPQFYKEHCVAGLERVFETGHVYRAEPHCSPRHLTEYYSLDLEMGFITGPQDLIELEKELLNAMFIAVRDKFQPELAKFDAYLPSLSLAPTWTFTECLQRLADTYQRTDLTDDLDPLAERQLCILAAEETGVQAVFVIGFPMSSRPFYTKPQADTRFTAGFDLLFRGLEVTTGGQRLHTRTELEFALQQRGVDIDSFQSHLQMFDMGMPPHGGLAIGLERLTAQILGLNNIRECTLYPRDRDHVSP